jgi:hypothetical protein
MWSSAKSSKGILMKPANEINCFLLDQAWAVDRRNICRSPAKFTRVNSDFIGCSLPGSLSGFMTVKQKQKCRRLPGWIWAVIQIGLATNWPEGTFDLP